MKLASRDIITMVCKEFDIAPEYLQSASRNVDHVRPRKVAYYLMQRYGGVSLPQIGRMLGQRDHTTILQGIRTLALLRERDRAFSARVDALEQLCAEALAKANDNDQIRADLTLLIERHVANYRKQLIDLALKSPADALLFMRKLCGELP